MIDDNHKDGLNEKVKTMIDETNIDKKTTSDTEMKNKASLLHILTIYRHGTELQCHWWSCCQCGTGCHTDHAGCYHQPVFTLPCTL
jgi:hypothetical protein